MQYRWTPLETGLLPSELLNGRQIRTRLDALVPSPAHAAQGKQARQASKSQQNEKSISVNATTYQYRVGAPCYPLYFGPKRNKNPQWIPAVVVKVYGTRSVNVRVLPRGINLAKTCWPVEATFWSRSRQRSRRWPSQNAEYPVRPAINGFSKDPRYHMGTTTTATSELETAQRQPVQSA